jgi:hypothetical protein
MPPIYFINNNRLELSKKLIDSIPDKLSLLHASPERIDLVFFRSFLLRFRACDNRYDASGQVVKATSLGRLHV